MSTGDADARFQSLAEEILSATWEFYPTSAAGHGLHDYDGRLPDVSGSAIGGRIVDLERFLTALRGIDLASLGSQAGFDHQVLEGAVHRELVDLADLRVHQTNPMVMLDHLDLSMYVKRDYAPLSQRIEALISAMEAAPRFLASMRDGLSHRLSGVVIEAGVEAYNGLAAFFETDLSEAAAELSDELLKRRLRQAGATAAKAVRDFAKHLDSLKNGAPDSFAIGEEDFLALLRHGEMADIPLERLRALGYDDLARNLVRFRHAARQIDASKSAAEVMADVARDHPTADGLIPETRDMLEEIRQFLLDRDIVTVPSEVRCVTTETPAFMRWATAALDFPGAYETKATETYYYVTPVEAHWTDEQKEQWLTAFNYPTLRNVSVHEAYPGHYVHYLHTKTIPPNLSHVFGSYSFWEGWAHYTEEMMAEEGFYADDPRYVMGQLSDALLRDCRFICSIRMHTEGMTVDEATQFFVDNAYMEELPARKEAMRGTFDPMYLNYTLGKLMIQKLREDYAAEQGAEYSLKRFHDAFLSFGAPPIPLVRQLILDSPGRDAL